MEFQVKRDELVKWLKPLYAAIKGKNLPEAVFSCEENLLHIQFGGASVDVPGIGQFLGQARIKGKMFRNLVRLLPEEDKIILRRNEDGLAFGNLTISADWRFVISEDLQLPVNASEMDILQLIYQHPINQIIQSGMFPRYQAAEEKKKKNILYAHEKLKAYGIKIETIENLVNETIKKQIK